MKTISRNMLLLTGILGTVVVIFLLRLVPPVSIYRHGGGGNACVHYQRVPILDPAEAKPILDHAIQRILQRLLQARDHLPALSDIDKASIEVCGFAYRKGSASCDRAGNSVCDLPGSCYLSLDVKYPFNGSVILSVAPIKEYPLEEDGFAYYTWLAVTSGAREIHGIIEQEMDRAAKELQKAARSKVLKAREEIHIAVRAGDAAKVEQLLAAKPELANAKDSRGYTPLHWAKDKRIAEPLLAKEADVNAVDARGLTPLHWAVYEGRFEVVKALVAHKADINRKASDGWTPMTLAEELGGEGGAITRLLLRHGGVSAIPDAKLNFVVKHPGVPGLKRVLQRRPDVLAMRDEHGRTALHNAVASQDKETVELLLAYYADTNAKDEKGERPRDLAHRAGSLAIIRLLQQHDSMKLKHSIHSAIHRRDVAEVKALITSRPTIVNEMSSSGQPPVHTALSRDNCEILKLLLDHHADANARDGSGRISLHLIVGWPGLGHDTKVRETAALLFARGADVNAKDNQGATPLHYAVIGLKTEAVEFLLANGADANARDLKGATPLHYAAERFSKEVLQFLLARKANINARDNWGKTPLHNAIRRHNKEAVELLLANKANANARDLKGATPLHYAAERFNWISVKVLLENKADVNARNSRGETAFHYTVDRMSSEGADNERFLWHDTIVRKLPARTPPRPAVWHVNTRVAELLLANGADVNARDDSGTTPLHLAASCINKAAVEFLLANGADINVRDNNGQTSMDRLVTRDCNVDLHPTGALLREHRGTAAKEMENASGPQSRVLSMRNTRDGAPMTASQMMDLRDLPDVKTARETLVESSWKYYVGMNALVTRLGYRIAYLAKNTPDGTPYIDRQLTTSNWVPLTPKQIEVLQNMPELKAFRKAGMEAAAKYTETVKAAAARLGYQMESVTNRAPSATQVPPATSGTNGSVQEGVDGQQPSGKR